jgi:hypothetical protein
VLSIPTSYQFTPKDLQGSGLAWKRVRKQLNGLQTSFSWLQETDFGRVPSDRVWMITHLACQGTPGLIGDDFLHAYFTENDKLETGGAPVGLIGHLTVVVGGRATDGFTLELPSGYLVQPDHHVRAFAEFFAATGPQDNLVIVDVAGWLIPRANVEFAGS